MIRIIFSLTITIIFGVTAALADEASLIEAMKQLTLKLTNLDNKIDHLQAKIDGGTVQEGTVLAFLGTEDKPCPPGPWSLFAEAKGRVIVGAGGSVLVGSTGGRETRTYNYVPILSGGDGSVNAVLGVDNDTRGPGWQAYTNMPPYIALYLCRKDPAK